MNRSGFFYKMAAGAIGAAVFQKKALAGLIATENRSDLFYTGSYTQSPEQGISLCRFDPDQGTVQLVEVCKGVANPSFLILDHQRKFIYAVNELADFEGKSSGAVSTFRRDDKSGRLTFLNARPSLGADPCHLTIDRTGKYILVANYTGGNVAVLPILANGDLGDPVEMVKHAGKGPNTSRQEGPHAHSVNLSPDNRFAFVCDLGIDRIMVYRFDQQTGKLSAADRPWFQSAPGAGPRHFTFSKDGGNAYVVNELNSTLTAFRYETDKGLLTETQTLSTLPPDYIAENTCADIHLHPNGRFVYASNRGHDSIAVFSIEQGSGKIKLIQNQTTEGKTPRNFALHSSGRFLLSANQDSDAIRAFTIDPSTGRLGATGSSVNITKPVCIIM